MLASSVRSCLRTSIRSRFVDTKASQAILAASDRINTSPLGNSEGTESRFAFSLLLTTSRMSSSEAITDVAASLPARVESDSFGDLPIAAGKLWGAQTQRSIGNFPIGGQESKSEW